MLICFNLSTLNDHITIEYFVTKMFDTKAGRK